MGSPDAAPSGVGARWGCLSQERPTRFIVAWGFGENEDDAAPPVVRKTRARTRGQAGVPWVSDGRAVYRREVPKTYRDPHRSGRRGRPRLERTAGVGLVQAVKQREGSIVVGVEVRVVLGEPIACPYTVHIERLNGVLRDRLACLTRKTHAFAKVSASWDAAVMLSVFEHNWLRPHRALREGPVEGLEPRLYRQRTPAMAIGLTDHLWSWEEFLTHRIYHYQRE